MVKTNDTSIKRARSRRSRALLVVALTAILLAGLLPFAGGCSGGLITITESLRGSGVLQTQQYAFEDFTKIEISSAFDVTITRSDSYSVSVTVDDNLMDVLEVRESGDTLQIGVRGTVGLTGTTLKAAITMPLLNGVEASGASRATIAGFTSAEDLSLKASGASRITGAVTAGTVDAEVSGASKVELQGSAAAIRADVSGASQLVLADFAVIDADVSISGASQGTVNVSGRLDAELSGASELRYTGEPALGDVDISGSSRLRKL